MAEKQTDKLLFRLFRFGNEPSAQRAEENLRAICEQHVDGPYGIEVIDLASNMQLAEEHDIFATPTVERIHPPPKRRVIGDLSDRSSVLQNFGLIDSESPEA